MDTLPSGAAAEGWCGQAPSRLFLLGAVNLPVIAWVFVPGGVLAAGLSLWLPLASLSWGSVLDCFSLVEHEVQAVADKLDDCKEDGHRAAVEQRCEDIWRKSQVQSQWQQEQEQPQVEVAAIGEFAMLRVVVPAPCESGPHTLPEQLQHLGRHARRVRQKPSVPWGSAP